MPEEGPTGVDLVRECLTQNIAQLSWMVPLKAHTEKSISNDWVAIGFDTNALKKLRRYPANTRATILTYLQSKSVPIVLPAQAIQEFWNNHGLFTRDVLGIESDTRKLAARYERLHGGGSSKQALERIAAEVSNLAEDVADSQNPRLLEESVELWDLLLPEARLAHVPRNEFVGIGESRLASGIAPGFADEKKRANGLGDFFVWADFLFGLVELGLPKGSATDPVIVFVTDDGKEDWLSSGIPHPTLLGEVFQLTGRTLQIFGMDDLKKIVQV